MRQCRICAAVAAHEFFTAREMMLGLEDEFSYFQCARCGCLQIADIPLDLSKYYPPVYYSFKPPVIVAQNFLTSHLKTLRLRFWLAHHGVAGRMLAAHLKEPYFLAWMKNARLSPESKILDVGCGGGELLVDLFRYGFSDLTGVDANIPGDVVYSPKFRILKKELTALSGAGLFDFIMLHHSLEHMPNQHEALSRVNKLLRPHGGALVRIPLADSWAWRTYGVHWVQLDAPRHFFLHTRNSFSLAAHNAGFEVADVIFDSSEFQFWGSEQYKAGIPLSDDRSFSKNPARFLFSEARMAAFKAQARELNKRQEGDMACFLLRAV
jgi:SAM-dependent methyltransferase